VVVLLSQSFDNDDVVVTVVEPVESSVSVDSTGEIPAPPAASSVASVVINLPEQVIVGSRSGGAARKRSTAKPVSSSFAPVFVSESVLEYGKLREHGVRAPQARERQNGKSEKAPQRRMEKLTFEY
jgi:hypothetical protein